MIFDLALLKATLPDWYEVTMYDAIQIAARKHDLEPALVAAFVSVESGFNPYSIKYEEGFRYVRPDYRDLAHGAKTHDYLEKAFEMSSIGLMQIMGATARDEGFRKNLVQLFDPYTNLEWGCAHLSRLVKKHTNLESVISAYNAGTPRKIGGKFTNQDYVDKVMSKYKELKQKNVIP